MTQRELLSVRLCDLGVSIEGTWLEESIERVREELAQRDLRFNPHFWLSDEWFSPAGVPASLCPSTSHIPSSRVSNARRCSRRKELPAKSCMRLLRHELGHAIQHAFNLQRRREWQRQFGKASKPYPDAYRPNPASRRYVHNLPAWYAQSHPEEDFAETFSVWLRPRYNWRRRYGGWPALRKLEYVDGLMAELAGQPPRVRSRAKPYALSRERTTLGAYYERKRAHYSVGFSDAYDRDLKRLFRGSKGRGARREAAAAFLRRHRREIRAWSLGGRASTNSRSIRFSIR